MSVGRGQRALRKMGWLVTMAAWCAAASAQQIGVTYSATAQTEAALKSLSPTLQTVMDRLEHLGSLPVDYLRYHAGDLRDGAADALNDSSWETIQIPYTASTNEVWLRKRIEIPKTINGYDPTGAKLWLQGPTRGDVVVYVAGKRIARGEDMEPLVLLNPIKPGDKLLLAIHLGKTKEPKRLRRMELRLDFAPNRPNPEVLRKELLSAALLVPSFAPERKSSVDQAIEAVNLKALDSGDSQAFDQSLEKSKQLLDSLKPTLQATTFI